jgi:predicted nucleic acid-binding Zn finger protein
MLFTASLDDEKMPIGKLIEKAESLLNSGRVEALGGGKFNVVGDHGTYIVVENYDGKISCNCPGFLKRGRCSHSTAVLLLTKTSRRRKSRPSKE